MVSGKKILYYSTLSVLLLYFLFAGLIKAKPFLAPFAVATVLALLVFPLSRKMEKSFLTRSWASLINTFLVFILSLGFFALFSMQVKNLVDDWPKIKETMKPKVENLKNFVFEHTPLSQQDLEKSSEGPLSIPFLSTGSKPGQKAATFFTTVLNFFGTYLLTFIYIFFILNYRRHFRKFLLRLFPDEKRIRLQKVVLKSATVIQQYLIGKLILIAFLSIFYSIGLGFSGVSNFILVSVLAAIFSIIPYVGNVIGFGMAMVFGYLTSGNPGVLIGISLTFFIGQFVESYILEPYIVGDKVDLHPFITILVVVVGNLVWGLIGMILAIPLLAIVNIIFLNVHSLEPFGFLLSKKKEGRITMDNSLLHQFSGFLETSQIWEITGPFPFEPYKLKKIDLQKLPKELYLPPTMVLGKRMERFFHFYVNHFSEEKVIAHNEQIIFEKKTLGELDFLLKNENTGKILHVELVYKFYLYDPNIPAESERWTGPNHRDNLSRKLNRLLNKQFPLLHRKETEPLLNRLGIKAEDVEQQICFKGNFFLPWDDSSALPKPSCGRTQDRWLRVGDFRSSRFGNAQFFSPKKPEWPILPQNNTRWLNFEEIRSQILPLLEKEQSPLIWMKTNKGEFYRFFVVWW